METIAVFIKILLFYLLIKTTLRLFTLSRLAKKVKEADYKQADRAAEAVTVVEEMVRDEICGATLPRSKSYILVRNNREYYFCSWNCRQKFLDGTAELT